MLEILHKAQDLLLEMEGYANAGNWQKVQEIQPRYQAYIEYAVAQQSKGNTDSPDKARNLIEAILSVESKVVALAEENKEEAAIALRQQNKVQRAINAYNQS